MTHHSPPNRRLAQRTAAPAALDRRAERLVVQGLRGWMAGYETGDIACWEAVWNDYCRELGHEKAKRVVSELAAWVRVLRNGAGRPIDCYPRPCRFMCRDECLALRLLGGCQKGHGPIASDSACKLIASSRVSEVLEAARCYAEELADAGLELDPVTDEMMTAIAERPAPASLS